MQDPISLFSYADHVDQRTVHAQTLVVTLGSFVDAGHAQRLVDATLLDGLPNHELGRFDADQLFDYAGHRPLIAFDRDRFTSFQAPKVTLHHVTDADGTPFLLLNGPEPHLQWERMAASIAHLIDQFDVELTVLAHAIPAPAPHTRPIAVTPYASDTELLPEHTSMLGSFQMSASFGGLLALRLGEAGHDVLGLMAHVPHYLADSDYPPAALAVLEQLRERTALNLPTAGLEAAASLVRAQGDAEVQSSEEVQTIVGQLEQQYDAFMAGHRALSAAEADLPSAEEIGDQFEDFLKNLPDEGKDSGTP